MPLPNIVLETIQKFIENDDNTDFCKNNRDNIEKSMLAPYFVSNPDITRNIKIQHKCAYSFFQKEEKCFLTSPWETSIDTIVFASPIYLLLPEKSDLEKFTIDCRVINNEKIAHQARYNLSVSEVLYDIKTVNGFYWIPLHFLINHNDIFCKKIYTKIVISLESKINVQSYLKYFSIKVSDLELRAMLTNPREAIMKDIEQISFKNKINLPNGWLFFLLWNTDIPVTRVTLTDNETGISHALDRGDFQYFERLKAKLPQLKNNWGSYYFTRFPDDILVIDSGLAVNDSNHYTLEFFNIDKKEITGDLWVVSVNVYLDNNSVFAKRFI